MEDGKGDLLEEVSKSATKYDMNMGVYLSPWDANNLNIMFQLKKSITNTISTNSRKSLAILNTETMVNSSKYGWMVRVVAELKK